MRGFAPPCWMMFGPLAARIGLTATLYLIGTGISVATLRRVGHRPMLLGVILWLIISTGSLWLIREGWIAL